MAARSASWLNRNVIGMAVTSFFADAGYEMVSAVLPGFLATIGVAAEALGWIEGFADALASFVKLGAGWYSDRIGHRKPIVTLGYFLSGTALSVFAVAVSWPLVLAGRVVAWFGKGIRSPLRDAMLADSISAEARGRVFGMHRAADTAGAVAGPLIGVWLLSVLPHRDPSSPFRSIFLISVIPGLISCAAITLLVQEKRVAGNRSRTFWKAVRELPRPYLRFLLAAGVFGAGDFAPTLLTLAAIQLLAPIHGIVRAGQIAALCYVIRNVAHALIAFPAGVLGDLASKRHILAAGYGLGGVAALAAAALFAWRISALAAIVAVFVVAGTYTGIYDAMEGAIPADMIASADRGTAYGLLGAVNGAGDLVASALVGTLWSTVSPVTAFCVAGALMLAGAVLLMVYQDRRASSAPTQTAA